MSRKSKTVLGVVVGSALLVGSFGAVAASADSPQPNPHAFRQVSQPTIGHTVRDGQFEFVVTDVDVGEVRIGSDITAEQPAPYHESVVVRLTVRNLGDGRLLPANAQVLVHGNMRHHASRAAWKTVQHNTFVRPIPAGGLVQGKLVFDIPKNGKPTMLKLRGSMKSKGVKVKLHW